MNIIELLGIFIIGAILMSFIYITIKFTKILITYLTPEDKK